jgi:hypothetical protein
VIFDNMTKEDYEMSALLKGKSRMEIDEILGGMEYGRTDTCIW